MYDSTKFPTSNQLAGRTPPAGLGAVPERLVPAPHRRSPGRDQRGRQSVAQPGQDPGAPSPAPPQTSRAAGQVDPPAMAPTTGTLGPRTTGLRLSRRRLDPAQGGPGYPAPLWCPVPPLPGRPYPQAVRLEPPEAPQACQPAGRRSYSALERGALARPEKKARAEGRTIVFVDETGCYLLPLVVKTYAPKGKTPVFRAPLSRDHLSVISGITAHGWLHIRMQDRPFRGVDAARFLRHLSTHISVRLLVIWDRSPIHRCQEVKAFLTSPVGQGVHLEQLPAYAPELNPDEGVWNYLKRVELKNVICQHLGQLSYELGKAIKRLRQKPHIIRACIVQAGLV